MGNDRAHAARSYHFIVVVWGEKYVNDLLDWCLPSLLAPGNLPTLERAAHQVLVAAPAEDWVRIAASPIAAALAPHADLVHLPIPAPGPEVAACLHMGIGHTLATQHAFAHRALGVLLTPDLMLSDGTLAAVQARQKAGAEVVLAAALRCGEEPLFEHLAPISTRPEIPGSRIGAVTLSGRQLAGAAIESFHSETRRYEWDSSWFCDFPSACWFRVPGERGIVILSLSWAPLLVDYAAIAEHDASTMQGWTIDGDYIYKNFGELAAPRLHVVQDSDEAIMVSWTPMATKPQKLKPHVKSNDAAAYERQRADILRSTFYNPVFDPLKRRIFTMPVRWHADEATRPAWEKLERDTVRRISAHLTL